MASFIGDYTCKADSKCRVVVPASFRRVMVASQQTFFVLRKNVFGKCIDMYPLQEWENMIAGVRARLNLFDPKHAAFFREFCRGTQERWIPMAGFYYPGRCWMRSESIRKWCWLRRIR